MPYNRDTKRYEQEPITAESVSLDEPEPTWTGESRLKRKTEAELQRERKIAACHHDWFASSSVTDSCNWCVRVRTHEHDWKTFGTLTTCTGCGSRKEESPMPYYPPEPKPIPCGGHHSWIVAGSGSLGTKWKCRHCDSTRIG